MIDRTVHASRFVEARPRGRGEITFVISIPLSDAGQWPFSPRFASVPRGGCTCTRVRASFSSSSWNKEEEEERIIVEEGTWQRGDNSVRWSGRRMERVCLIFNAKKV